MYFKVGLKRTSCLATVSLIDVAERVIEMAQNYANIMTKDDKVRAMIIQGVDMHRKKFPDFGKNTLNP